MSLTKRIKKFLIQANKMDKVDPVVAYYCRMYAMRKGVECQDKTDQEKKLLFSVMNKLEEKSADMKDLSKEEAAAHVEKFALQVFKAADDEDRGPGPTKRTAKTFNAAYVFLEVCKQFDGVDPGLQTKCKYALWKAIDISTALREGREPKSGSKEEQELAELPDPGLDSAGMGGSTLPDAAPAPPDFSLPQDSQPTDATDTTTQLPGLQASDASVDLPPPQQQQSDDAAASSGAQDPLSVPNGVEGRPAALPVAQPPVSPSAAFPAPAAAPTAPAAPMAYPAFPAASAPAPAPAPASAPAPLPVSARPRAPANALVISPDNAHSDLHDAVDAAARLIRHGQSALRFDDTDACINKLSEAIALLLPHQKK